MRGRRPHEEGQGVMAATVLVVEDERKLRDFIRSYLERAGLTVLSTGSGAEAITMAAGAAPDLVVLDLGLPDVPGETVARELRAMSPVPILMLTAKAAEEDRIRGLELGADDYVTKPFSPRELVLRVQAILRRGGTAAAAHGVARYGGGALVIDEPRRTVTVRGAESPAHAYGVGDTRHAGDGSRAGVLSLRADQQGAGLRVRGVRAHGRLAREEPAPQDRGGPGEPRDHPDRARRRLPARPVPR